MMKDITWVQKVRVSALRAACASEFETESEFVPTHVHPDTGEVGTSKDCPGEDVCNREEAKWFPEKDERRTERILARAEMFEAWLHRAAGERVADITNDPRAKSGYYGRPVKDNPQA